MPNIIKLTPLIKFLEIFHVAWSAYYSYNVDHVGLSYATRVLSLILKLLVIILIIDMKGQ